jgi:hypothetical protein
LSNLDPPCGIPNEWARLPVNFPENRNRRVWISEADRDPAWDFFLLGTPLGQFQQSSAWARVKRIEGWRATRWIVTERDKVVAGFQILWKSKLGLRFGYVSKGPVSTPAFGAGPSQTVGLLKQAASRLRLSALVAQPPDFDHETASHLSAAGFLENRLIGVLSATIAVDLARPFKEVERGFSHNVCYDVRRQRKNNVLVRFGDAHDAEIFFDLMLQSCSRQKVAPNPSNAGSIRAISEEFCTEGGVGSASWAGFLLAECDGRVLAGVLLIRFGDCLSLWKKGVALDAGRAQPNRLLDFEAMKWGHQTGARRYELVGLDREVATQLLAHTPRASVPMNSSDYYKLHFGGTPVLLPEAKVWTPSFFGRFTYGAFLALRRFGRKK